MNTNEAAEILGVHDNGDNIEVSAVDGGSAVVADGNRYFIPDDPGDGPRFVGVPDSPNPVVPVSATSSMDVAAAADATGDDAESKSKSRRR